MSRASGMYYTFLIVYSVSGSGNYSASFCAHDKASAVRSFFSWCQSTNLSPIPTILAIMIIYSESDHMHYGERYGFPHQYAK